MVGDTLAKLLTSAATRSSSLTVGIGNSPADTVYGATKLSSAAKNNEMYVILNVNVPHAIANALLPALPHMRDNINPNYSRQIINSPLDN